MPQIKKSYTEVTIPLQKMTFTPDVPSAALGGNEYNIGENVETDVRGIRSVNGEKVILGSLDGTPIYVTGGFRPGATPEGENTWWFIVAAIDADTNSGKWWMNNGGGWVDITPTNTNYDGSEYTQATDITESWNGTVVVFNDGLNNPFFLPDIEASGLVMYGDRTADIPINSAVAGSPATGQVTITYSTAQAATVFQAGEYVAIRNSTTRAINGNWRVISNTTTEIVIACTVTGSIALGPAATVSRAYVWNYQPGLFSKITAKFVRLYNTPNVGSILVAGNLTVTDAATGLTTQYPVTVRNSQAFALNQVPESWEPTNLNVANELEVPLRGEVLDAFPSNGNLYVSSYWDTVVLSPLNYSTTNAPILGVRLFNQGRGLLNPNCWANSDDMVYGVDARDIWAFNGQTFTGIGNQRVKHFFFDQLDPEYIDRVFVEVNTEKNQVEVYYPDSNATNGVPNKMISYRYDLDCWNPPRDVSIATFACESPVWFEESPGVWKYNDASRTMTYIKAVAQGYLVMKDQGYTFIGAAGQPININSVFRRDNIKLVKDYSSKTLVHRVLPEAVNLNDNNVQINPVDDPTLVGNIKLTVEGANSVGQAPQTVVSKSMSTDTDYPWVQISQNAHRVNSVEITNDTNTPETLWMVTALTWQFAETEDDR
jgi:hypothetical protein